VKALEMAKRNTPAKAGRKEWGELFASKKKAKVVEQSVYTKTSSTMKKVDRLKASLK
jgi:hypothetical protein|tara:strand:+ start:1890 stop:2060 length:171 start_codon:yes stop_codon:yes gene_type:complete